MPKVLRIINRLNLGGPTYNVCYLSKYIDARFETLLASGIKDETEASSAFIAEDMGLKPIYIPDMHRSLNPFKDKKAFGAIKQLIKDYKPDIVHTHAAKAGALGRLAAHQCGVPIIIHTFHGHVFHSYFNPIKTRVFIEIERYLANISTKIIAISDIQKVELGTTYKICKPEKIEVVPLGFDLVRFQQDTPEKRKAFRAKYNLDDDEIAIGIVGRLVPIKNHPLFLNAIKLSAQHPSLKIRAFIIGDGEDRQLLETFCIENELPFINDNFEKNKALVTFTSWIKDVDVAYAGLDIVALTSLNEGTPVSLIEAQAANKPIVSTEVGGIRDVVQAGKTALLSASGDIEQLSENINLLCRDSLLRLSMGNNAYQYVYQKFNYTRLTKDMALLYDKLLGVNTQYQ